MPRRLRPGCDMPTTTEPQTALQLLCEALDAVPGPMQAAFRARMQELHRATLPDLRAALPDDAVWWGAWYEKLVALLRLDLQDPLCVPLLVAVVRWGMASGVDERSQRLALEALAWACRDVVSDLTPPPVLAAIEARAAFVERVWRRLAAPLPVERSGVTVSANAMSGAGSLSTMTAGII